MAKLKDLQEGLAEIRKLYGTASVFQAHDNFRANIQSVSTGSFNLNDAIGVSGVPSGRLVMLSGVESSGKSLLALSIIKEAQKEGGIGYYIDGEYTYDPDWTARLGVDHDRMIISQTNSAKEVFELLLGKPKIEGKRKNAIPGILTNEKILKAGLKVIVIDSIDALAAPMEITSEVGKANIALMARFLPPELRRLTPILSKTNVTIIAIMQARQTPGQIYGDSLTVSGGRALKHAASTWIDLGVVGGSAITIDGNKDGEKVGHRIRAKIKKNKVAPPFKTAEFTIYFQKGVDVRPEIPIQAVNCGVIIKESEKIYSYKSKLGIFRWNGKNQVMDEVGTNKLLLQEIALKVKQAKKKENEDRLADTSFKDEEIMEGKSNNNISEGDLDLDLGPDPQEDTGTISIIESGSVESKDKSKDKKLEDSQKSSDSSNKILDSSSDVKNLDIKTFTELKQMAKKMKIPNFYKLTNKDSLIKAIINQT